MADIKWSAFPSTASAAASGDTLVGLHSGANYQFGITATPTSLAIGQWDTNSNFSANNFLPGFATIVSAAGNTVLTVASKNTQEITGSTTHTITMPVVSTLVTGFPFKIINNSSGAVTVNSSGGNAIQVMAAGTTLLLTCVSTSGTTAASWNATYVTDAGGTVSPGTANQLAYYASTGSVVSGLSSANSASLVTGATGVPAWSSTMTNGQLIIGSTGATPTAATLTEGSGIVITNGAGSVTISVSGSGYDWTEVTTTSQQMDVDSGYIANNASLVTLTLPPVAGIGDSVILQGKGAGLFAIAQNGGQTIHFGDTSTTTGVTGGLTAVNRYNSVELVCITANTDWAVITGTQGAFNVA